MKKKMNRFFLLYYLFVVMNTSCFIRRKHDFYVGFYSGFKKYDVNAILNNKIIYNKIIETNYSIVKAGGFSFSSYLGDTLIIKVGDFDSDTIILDRKQPYIPISIRDSIIFYESPIRINRW
jgi:hypothetical protein